MCACVFVCVHIGMLKDFLLCVPPVFFNSVGRRAKAKLVFLGKEGEYKKGSDCPLRQVTKDNHIS